MFVAISVALGDKLPSCEGWAFYGCQVRDLEARIEIDNTQQERQFPTVIKSWRRYFKRKEAVKLSVPYSTDSNKESSQSLYSS